MEEKTDVMICILTMMWLPDFVQWLFDRININLFLGTTGFSILRIL